MANPCFYLIDLGQSLDGRSVLKIGTTFHPEDRKFHYVTGNVNPVKYSRVFRLDPICFKTRDSLYKLDSVQFPIYLHSRNHGSLKVNGGGGTEFYLKSDLVPELMRSFLDFKNIRILEEIVDDPYTIRNSTPKNSKLIYEEDIEQSETLFQKFKNTFLPEKPFRRIQMELWDRFETVCDSQEHYRGIVQWPTGTGKTIGMLMMIVLAANKCEQDGKIYKGVIVTTKNDIFDTISKHFNNLRLFGITVYDGSHTKFSKLSIPTNTPSLIIATHAAIVRETNIDVLRNLTHIHYDEVHHITADGFTSILDKYLEEWNPSFITGTSATPETCVKTQHERLANIFGNPYTILHRCDVDESVSERWIAVPRFHVSTMTKCKDRKTTIGAFVDKISEIIRDKKETNWKGGKIIAYVRDSIEDVQIAAEYAKTKLSDTVIYQAVGDRTDKQFCDDPADGTVRILFACQRYLEGSDIEGIEMTCVLAGDRSAANVIIQIAGRALRNDYSGKEGWCAIVRPSDDAETDKDVLDSIVLTIADFTGKLSGTSGPKFEEVGTVLVLSINGVKQDLVSTVGRIQAAYIRREYSLERLTFDKVRTLCVQNKIECISEYRWFRDENPSFPEDPWRSKMSAYDFLHPFDHDRISLEDFKLLLVENGIRTTEDYVNWNDGSFPSVDHCIEGYFPTIQNFQDLLPSGRRRR